MYTDGSPVKIEVTLYNNGRSIIPYYHSNLQVPASKIEIKSLRVSQEIPLADIYCVNWVVGNELLTQVFSTESGCFRVEDQYLITMRDEPYFTKTSLMEIKEIFQNPITVTPYNRTSKEVVRQSPHELTVIQITFSRKLSRLERIWKYFGFSSGIDPLRQVNF